MIMSREQNAVQNSDIYIGNESFTTVKNFKYLGTTLTDQNTIHERIKQVEGRERLLLFGAESFVFQFTIKICIDWDIQKYNPAGCFMRLWSLVSDTEGGP